MKTYLSYFSKAILLFFSLTSFSYAIEDPATIHKKGLSTKLGTKVAIDTLFDFESGDSRPISAVIEPEKPFLIIPVYYSCPRLCGFLLTGVANLVKDLSLKAGKDYKLLTISFDPQDTIDIAKQKGKEFRALAGIDPDDVSGWEFAVGKQKAIDKLMNSIGFNYKSDKGEYAHSSVLVVLTSLGKISQFFTGIEFSSWDTKLALVEASEGRVGNPIDHILLSCFRFDPLKGKYTFAAITFVRVGSGFILLLLLFFLIRSIRRSKA
jgi:protein SCO1